MLKEFEKRLLSSLILIPIAFFFIIKGSKFFIFFLSIIFFIICFEWIKMNKRKDGVRIIGIIFLFFSLYTAFYLRENSGLYFFLFIIIICIFTDIGGYIFGKTFKGPKLTSISPNKTYSGVIGSFLFSLISAIIYIKYFGNSFDVKLNTFSLLFLILFVSLISQVGDLIISYFKRKAKLKDTGKILPGHGGLLDRIDGLIFVLPIIYLFKLI
tara:strand:+ start:10856 stop:11491 length:636 start_codon:yes stop_codon:yes gene_type:complete